MAAVDKLTRQMLAGEQMSSVAALARDAPEWARAFVDAAEAGSASSTTRSRRPAATSSSCERARSSSWPRTSSSTSGWRRS